MLARDIMTTSLIVISPQSSLREAAELMARHNISGLPVLNDDQKLVGIISESDLIENRNLYDRFDHWIGMESFLKRKKLAETDDDAEYREEMENYLDGRVEDVMTKRLITAAPDTPAADVARLMVGRKINRVPVLSENRLVGIITRGDILKAIGKQL